MIRDLIKRVASNGISAAERRGYRRARRAKQVRDLRTLSLESLETRDLLATLSDGGVVWDDVNDNGVQDGTEQGVPGVTVNLYTDVNGNLIREPGGADGSPIATTTTSDGTGSAPLGYFAFPDLPEGKCFFEVEQPSGFGGFSPRGPESDSTVNAYGFSDIFEVHPDEIDGHGLVVDNFREQSQFVKVFSGSTTSPSAIGDSRQILGSQRDVTVTVANASSGASTRLLIYSEAVGGRLSFAVPGGVSAGAAITYDGPGTPGLGLAADLTRGGLDDRFLAQFAGADLGTVITIQMEDTHGNRASLAASDLTAARDLHFPYADFVQEPGNTDGVDFTSIAVITELIRGPIAIDADLGELSTGYLPNGFGAGLTRIVVPASLGDTVWHDTNDNGLQDDLNESGGEPGVAGATVTLLADLDDDGNIDDVVETTVTADGVGADALGFYQFTGLTPGVEYQVQFDLPSGYDGFTTRQVDGDPDGAANSDGPLSDVVVLRSAENNLTIDFGYAESQTGGIGDFFWYDSNGNGRQDSGETGVPGASVQLLDENSAPILGKTTTTSTSVTDVDGDGTNDPIGSYFFGDLPAGEYYVQFVNPGIRPGWAFTTKNATGVAAGLDSDANGDGVNRGKTDAINLGRGEVNKTIDAGLAPPLAIGGEINLAVTASHRGCLCTDTACYTSEEGFVYTIEVTNDGPEDAENAKVVDTLPDLLINSSWTATGTLGTNFVSHGTGDLNETVDIPVGGRITYTIRSDISVTPDGPLANTVTVTAGSGQSDTDLSNNVATDIAEGDELSLVADGPAVAGKPLVLWVYCTDYPCALVDFAVSSELASSPTHDGKGTLGLANPEIFAAGINCCDGAGFVVYIVPDDWDGSPLYFQSYQYTGDVKMSNVLTIDRGVVSEDPQLETGIARDVGSDGWTRVNLPHVYNDMVVVATPNYSKGGPPLVARVQNAEANSFQVQVQRADGLGGTINGISVQYTVVEAGVYTEATHGVKMEAVKSSIAANDSSGNWHGVQRVYLNDYDLPVVVGQVMSSNDSEFSTFWARGAAVNQPPSNTSLFVGKHVGSAKNRAPISEVVGYIVIETGGGSIGGQKYVAGVGDDTVLGTDNASPVVYPLSGLDTVANAVVSSAGMDGVDGAWPVLAGDSAVSPAGLRLIAEEDQISDSERRHTTEQMAYLAFGPAPVRGGISEPNLRTGVLDVASADWHSVTLDHTYADMVVVASANYSAGNDPLVTRIRNASGNRFEVRVQRADDLSTPITDVRVHYTVVESGVYTEAQHGVTMEASKVTPSKTNYKKDWGGTVNRVYVNRYASPVVIGQVMTTNDPALSIFWAHGATEKDPPSPSKLYVGKHVGQDSDTTRLAETLGYIVIESGSGTVDGVSFTAGVGEDTIVGPDNGNPETYSFPQMASVTGAVVSSAGMDGTDGAWPVLAGATPVTATSLKLIAEEDQLFDDERAHTTEQMAYLVFGTTPTQNSETKLRTGVIDMDGTVWQTVTLDKTYSDMVVVASANYASGQEPLVTRIRNADGNSFQVRVQRADKLSTSITDVRVHYTVVEAGVYNVPQHGIKMEAVKVTPSATNHSKDWGNTKPQAYANTYASPVVIGQVMTTNDSAFSVFWAHGATERDQPSSSKLYVGKHVGQDSDTTRSAETLGYIVIESGSGTVDGVSFTAGVGADAILGPDNGNPETYSFPQMASVTGAVLSSAGMDGTDGGWPVLAGNTPVTANSLKLFAEEDQLFDDERAHTTEQMAYLVFGTLGSPLRGSVTGDESGITGEGLTQQQAEALTTQALASWAEVLGVDELPPVDVSVADLPGDLLGVASGASITLDVNGAGVGWFIDPTPDDNDEFAQPVASAAVDKYDLVSAISHEIGHTLGLDHKATDQVMAEILTPGERLKHSFDTLDLITDDVLNDLAGDISIVQERGSMRTPISLRYAKC